ncbi:hypothetical protein Pam1_22 [Pseudanabaena phage Pam1]|nr:hypothetical protein Pam1_22 [Pseudanabaena phage Pam1]
MTADIVTLYHANCADIPAMLRHAADNVEVETDDHDRTVSMVCLQVHESGDIQVFGWGATDTRDCIATLAIAQHQLIQGAFGDD